MFDSLSSVVRAVDTLAGALNAIARVAHVGITTQEVVDQAVSMKEHGCTCKDVASLTAGAATIALDCYALKKDYDALSPEAKLSKLRAQVAVLEEVKANPKLIARLKEQADTVGKTIQTIRKPQVAAEFSAMATSAFHQSTRPTLESDEDRINRVMRLLCVRFGWAIKTCSKLADALPPETLLPYYDSDGDLHMTRADSVASSDRSLAFILTGGGTLALHSVFSSPQTDVTLREAEIQAAADELIPEEFQNDPVLQEHICPITLLPIRVPMRVRNTGPGPAFFYFERAALIAWFTTSGSLTNPLTRVALTPADIEIDEALHAAITDRLAILTAAAPAAGGAGMP